MRGRSGPFDKSDERAIAGTGWVPAVLRSSAKMRPQAVHRARPPAGHGAIEADWRPDRAEIATVVTIGTFTRKDGRISGTIQTLSINTALAFVPNVARARRAGQEGRYSAGSATLISIPSEDKCVSAMLARQLVVTVASL